MFSFIGSPAILSSRTVVHTPQTMGHCWSKVYVCGDCQLNDDIRNKHAECTCKNIHKINTTEKWEEKLLEASRDSKSMIVNFYSSWCSPSKSIAPAYCNLS
ncbi:hypothetical protein MANES_11G077251v8 [Manihot esculenta]|uniref:Uncharacterized protein n=1 Tax=Manihot esculenta TaxID=3983 RepID=A0ACB7GV73_MANES|nr:hypothetical protein MANES_11G077251v8 [Manihot esculenta]